jgi:hypothetical protein
VASFTCACAAGFSGDTCATNIDDCTQGVCENGGACTDLVDAYACQCTAGHAGDNCQEVVDVCADGDDDCSQYATCTPLEGGTHSCSCFVGYETADDGVTCTDIDECGSVPCANGGTCSDALLAFSCDCVGGFTGETCGTDINECGSVPCVNGGACTDGVDSYTCACEAGFRGATSDSNIEGV